ncbi:amino acid permease-domain-containing protein [Bombardia bombarda]|uniref:Amino acid permease-domain-containing protein n=1 Tax=Bombardia bombarda TaxID=252184 RepID=A0AA39U158_9PEZI|nr:amino acid permease-domain-containing protein [Bombardia bombarda]
MHDRNGEASGVNSPLLVPRATDPSDSNVQTYQSIRKSSDSTTSTASEIGETGVVGRSVEDDVLPETAVLGRNLGWSSAYIIIISRVIGSGIFATPGAIVSSVGSIGLSLLLWVAGALISWCGLAVSLEYGCMLPRSGGDKVYLEFTYRYPRFLASTLVAVNAILLGFTASNCIVFGEYLLYALGSAPAENPIRVKLLAVSLMTVITIIHGCFLRTGILIQNVLGWVKIGLVLFMVGTSAVVVVSGYNNHGKEGHVGSRHDGPSPVEFPTTWDGIWEGSVWNWGIISTALFKVFYSYAGLQNVNNVLNEVKDPVRTLKSAATTGLVTACLLYFLINVAYFLVVPLEDIKESGELIAALFFERTFGPTVGRVLLPLAVATSAAGNVMVVTFALARLNQEIARQGFLPYGDFLSSSRPFGAPLGGLIVHYIPSVVVMCIPAKNIYSFILEVEGYPGQFFVVATSVGLIWLRRTRPDLSRPYKAFLPAVWFRIVLSLALIAAPTSSAFTTIMATADVANPVAPAIGERVEPYRNEEKSTKHNVQTTLYYYLEPEDGSPPPPNIVGKIETYERPTAPLDVIVSDISGDEDRYTLDGNGFQIYHHESKEKDFADDDKIKAEYYPETEQLLKDATGAVRVFIFDHTIRRQPKDQRTPDAALRGPVRRVHIDQSYTASVSRVPFHLPDEAEQLLQKRFQIINVWRPIKTIYKDPLGIADAFSVPESDLVGQPLIYPNRNGETFTVKPNPAHKWYFKYAQRPDEVTLIKCFDSKEEPGVARRVPHSAFVDPSEESNYARESIEARALVFYDY